MRMLVLSLLVLGCLGTEEESVTDAWKSFLKMKEEAAGTPIVMSGEESKVRYQLFKSNYVTIQSINSRDNSWKAGVNFFSDRSQDELRAYTGLNISQRVESPFVTPELSLKAEDIAEAVNWVTAKKVVGIKSQGECGSCWAFAAVAAMESHYAIKGGMLTMMSDQQALDCTYSSKTNYDGCQGGWYTPVWERIRSHLGNQFPTAVSYQYKEKDSGSCTVGQGDNVLKAARVAQVYSKSVPYVETQSGSPYDSSLAAAVAIGPVAVAIEVTNPMYAYNSGIYSETCTGMVNHAVVVVGYDTKTFLIRNSWGSMWGEKGYINFDRSIRNQCFIAQYPEYPNMEVIEDQSNDGEDATDDMDDNTDEDTEGTESASEEATEEATTESPDPCDPNPCMNGGKCKAIMKGKKKGSYKCKCNKKKFRGDQCQEKIMNCKDKSTRCPDDRNSKKCQKNWAKKKCQMSCGLCYM